MKVREYKDVQTEVISDVLCNKCGSSCCEAMNFNGLINAKVFGAADSTHLEDYTAYEFDLCEKCLSELFDTFKFFPKTTPYYE